MHFILRRVAAPVNREACGERIRRYAGAWK